MAAEKKRRIRIAVYINEVASQYDTRQLSSAELNVDLPASLDRVMAQVRSALIATSQSVVALHGPAVAAAPSVPVDVELGMEAELPQTSPSDDLTDLPF